MSAPNDLFTNPRRVDALADELGHWLEICQLQREDIEFFTALVTESA